MDRIKISLVKSTLKKVFSNPFFLTLAVIFSLIFYLINVFILNYTSIISFFSKNSILSNIKFLYNLSIGFGSTLTISNLITLILTCVLVGIFAGLIWYKISRRLYYSNKKSRVLGVTGIALGIIAPGCAACGFGLIAALGLSGALLNFLPLGGLEISILSILILGFVIFKMSNDMHNCEVCQIDLKPQTQKNERGLKINGK